MKFDSLALCAVVDELRKALLGARVSQVLQPQADALCLGFRRGQERFSLWLSAGAGDCRAHLLDGPPPSPEGLFPFGTLLRKLLASAEVTALGQIAFDRILYLDLYGTDRLGTPRRWRLLGEFMGKHSNLIVIDEEEVIVTCLKPVTQQVNRYREVLPGRPYVPPPQGGKQDGLRLTEESYRALWPPEAAAVPLKAAFRAACLGISDDFWRLLCRRAGLDPEATSAHLPPDAAARLWTAWQWLRAAVEAGAWQPTLYRDAEGEPRHAYPFAGLEQDQPAWTAEPVSSFSQALEILSSAERKRAQEEHLRQALRQRLALALKQVQRRHADAAAALEQAGDPQEYQKKGELLLAHLSRITPGQEQVEVVDYYDPALASLTIALDPHLDGPANAQRYFAAAARARRARAHLPARLAALEAERATLEHLQRQVEQAADASALKQLEPAVEAAAGSSSPPPPSPQEKAWPRGLEKHLSRDGYEIVVAKNALQNEVLLSRIAAPTDLWFHVRGAGSSHVIVRTGGHPERVPPSTLQEAALLAARHSPARHSSLVPVSYTQRKYVTKVKGGGAGRVTYRYEKTLFVEP